MVFVEQNPLEPTPTTLADHLRTLGARASEQERRALTQLVRRVHVLETRITGKSLPRSWALRLRILQAIWEHDGHVTRACEGLGIYRPLAYYHRGACPLFKACWVAVVTARKSPAWAGRSWEDFWPAGLEEDLRRRLVNAQVVGGLCDPTENAAQVGM